MKRKMFTRTTAVLTTAAILGTALTGCGSETKTDDKASSAASEEAVVAEDGRELVGNVYKEGLPIVKEKQTFTIAVAQQSTLKSAAEKQCVIDAEEATGIHIEWIEIPQSGWSEKINIMFSTDALPDAIIGSVDTDRYYDQLVELDDLLVEYAPVMNEYFETRDDYPEAILSADGKLHCLPCGDEAVQNIIDAQYWINTEWLDTLGLEMPTTTDELKDVLIAFRDKDPNGNGKQDEIPFTFESAWGWGSSIKNLFGSFGVVENGYHVFTQDGEVIFAAEQQGYYDALEWMHELYAEGLIDSEVFTLSSDIYSARGTSADGNVVGVFAGYNGTSCGADNGENNDVYQPLIDLKGPNGDQIVVTNTVTREGFQISKSCENPEALVRWYDYINSSLELVSEWSKGPRGISWDITEIDGVEYPVSLHVSADVLEANGGYKTSSELRSAESFAGQSPTLWRKEWAENMVYGEGVSANAKLAAVKAQMEFGVSALPAGIASIENSERRSILLADIATYLQKFVADSVINGIDEAKWNTHLETLEKLKVEEYVTLCQEYVDSLK